MSTYKLTHGDSLEVLLRMVEDGVTVDSVITDPPYELGFMGESWDSTGIAFNTEVWMLCLQILKPGGHLLSFSGARTYHRMAVAIEDAGFEIRDQIMWLYGTGFPKSLDIGKAIDKAAGADRRVIGTKLGLPGYSLKENDTDSHDRKAYGKYKDAESECAITAPATEEAKKWDGWGTALKPAHEPVVVARKPLLHKTVSNNVIQLGTGGLNINASRVEGDRFPSNVILDEEAGALLDAMTGELTSGAWNAQRNTSKTKGVYGQFESKPECGTKGSTGGASRFFYCAKASQKERRGSKHPTVKPLKLMRYLCRLVTPPGGSVLDPFAGTGTTGEAALLEGFYPVLIEREAEYIADIEKRMAEALLQLSSSDEDVA